MNRLHRRNKRRKLFWNTITVLVIGFFIVEMIRAPIKIEQLRKNKVITIGIVIGTSDSWRTKDTGLEYIFQVDGKEHKGSSSYLNLVGGTCETLIGRSFPVIYSSTATHNNEILLTQERFKRYDMKQPDTLQWVEQYVKKGW